MDEERCLGHVYLDGSAVDGAVDIQEVVARFVFCLGRASEPTRLI